MFRQSQPTILLTRPLLQSQRFAKEVGGAVISPLMVTEFLSPEVPPVDFAALVLTSETGAEAARRISASGQVLPKQAFCVGARTALAARNAGFDAISAEGDVEALLALIVQHKPNGKLLFIRAEDSAGNLHERLNLAGLETFSAIAYKQNPLNLSAEARSLLQQIAPVIVPIFSPRSARLLTSELASVHPRAPIWLAALSPAVAAAFAYPADLIQIAAHPSSASMLKAVTALRLQGIGS